MATPASQPAIRTPKGFQPIDREALQSSIVQHFEQIALRHPDKIALRSETEQYTYKQVNEAANRIAQVIVARLGSSSEPVVFILDHAPAAIIAMLGILKSDKGYVPVDPDYPPMRIAYILDDTGTRLVITNQRNLATAQAALAGHLGVELLNLNTLNADIPTDNLELSIPPTNLAYILYTSGSTGNPKGVMHSHQDALNNTFSLTNDFKISSSDRLALFITFGFEASRFSIYSALVNGGTLCLYDIRSSGLASLPIWIAQEKITLLLSTPSTYRHMFDLVPKSQQMPSVRLIVLGGEPVSSQDIEILRRHFSSRCVLSNTFGMTETGVAAYYLVSSRTNLSGHSVPAGFPTGEKELELFDENGVSVKPGEPGEIWVKSRYLFPGYWRQPELSQQKISTDPQNPELRSFRTGDLGRKRQDGCLEHLGRVDSQVKIRGYRIEIAEIEAVLHEHPCVKDTAVIARETNQSPGQKQLIAYVVPDEKGMPSKKELQNFVAARLPSYMLPSVFVFLGGLPLTSTGKVNHQALPTPDVAGQAEEYSYLAPRDPIESQLVKIWERVLKVQKVGVQDNFFELGGDSLIAAHLFSQIEKSFGKKLPLVTLLQASTVEQQANILSKDDWTPDWSSLVALRAHGSKPPLYFIAPVGGNVLSYRDLLAHLPVDQPCYGLQALGLDGSQIIHRSVPEISSHYIKEITKFQANGPYFLGGSSFGGLVAYEMAQQLHDLGERVALVAMFDAYGPHYPRRLPSTSRVRKKFYKYVRRLDTHVSNLLFSSWQQRAEYIRVKSQKLFNRLSQRTLTRANQVLHPLPRELRRVRSAQMGAGKRRKRYMRENRRFLGRLVLFRATKQPLGIYPDPKLGWGEVVGDNIEVYEISGHHTSIIYEPRVQMLAEKFNQILTEAQSSSPDSLSAE